MTTTTIEERIPGPALTLPASMPATGTAVAAMASALRATGRTLWRSMEAAGELGLVTPPATPRATTGASPP